METKTCEQCAWWAKDPKVRGHEYFSSGWGLAVYDIDKAKEITKDGRPVYDCPVEKLKQFVDYPPAADGSFSIMTYHLNLDHIDHVNMDEPIILAYGLKARSDEKDQKRYLLLIDGTHRVAKAIKEGHAKVKTFILSEEETDQILADNRPPERQTKKKKAASNHDQQMPATLQAICGLVVKLRKEKGQNVFDFYHNDINIKTCFTYPKAKLFAEGVKCGKSLKG